MKIRRLNLNSIFKLVAYIFVCALPLQGCDSPRGDSEQLGHHELTLSGVSALGRIEPGDGVIELSGPPRPAVVIKELHVREGDQVSEGQLIAVLVGIEAQRSELERLSAVLADAENELARNKALYQKGSISDSDWRSLQLARDVAVANRKRAQAEISLSEVRAPIRGRVLQIHARPGERVGADGIVELADTSVMYAIAEVYETDIGRVRPGQKARIRSPALGREIEGEVERIGIKIGKKDTLSTDPVADADARVVEVRVRLLSPESAAGLTNLRVQVVFENDR